jgi:HEPN domain-containing protein
MATKADFQMLADMRIREARILLDAGECDGAYYVAGYAVECGLKACIIRKLMTSDTWPERKFSDDCYKHDLKLLLRVADLETAMNSAGPVAARWGQVKDWTEQSRYEFGKAEPDVRQFYEAITDPTDGVLPWIKGRW